MITTFDNGPFTIRRQSAPTEFKGRFVAGAETILSTDGTVQRMSARERLLLPEGVRQSDVIKIYTTFAFRVGNEENQIPGDIIEYKGDDYEIFQVEDWNDTMIPHYRANARRVDAHKAARQ